MKEYKRLGDYIREVNVRNRDLKVTNLLGLSVSKEFMPSIANTIGTDMSAYKIVERNQLVYIADTSRRGDKIAIGLLDKYDNAIVSQAYTVFEVVDHEQLLPEYLMMWFRRPEFDRYARFHSHGSAREIFDWSEMCDVMLPIPPIERQREFVMEYETFRKRIHLNEQMISKLEETAQTLYRKMFVDGIDKENLPEGWRMGKLGEVATVKSGYAFPSDWWQTNGISVIKIGSIKNNTIKVEDCDFVTKDKLEIAKNYIANKGDIVIAMTGATLGKIALVPQDGFMINQRVGLFDLGQHPLQKAPYLYWTLQRDDIINEIITVGGDSAQANVSNSDIEKIEYAIAPINEIETFNIMTTDILNLIILKHNEINKLTELQSLLLAKMGR